MDERSLIQRERLLSQRRQHVYVEQADEALPLSSFLKRIPISNLRSFVICADGSGTSVSVMGPQG